MQTKRGAGGSHLTTRWGIGLSEADVTNRPRSAGSHVKFERTLDLALTWMALAPMATGTSALLYRLCAVLCTGSESTLWALSGSQLSPRRSSGSEILSIP